MERLELERVELERFVVVDEFLDWLVLVGKFLERQLVEWPQLERLELVRSGMARSQLGLRDSETGR